MAEVSQVVPTAQLATATCALGTPVHTWQMTAQGKSSMSYTGMIRSAEAMSKAAIHLLNEKENLVKVKQEFEAFKAEKPYICPIQADVQPTILK